MRTIPTAMRQLWEQGGPFIGDDGAVHGRVTVEEDWELHITSSISTAVPSKLPFRWWQHLNNNQNETEIPNIKSIAIDRSLDADAATCEIAIYNQWMNENDEPNDDPRQLGNPGYFTWNYGEGDAGVRWGQSDSPWNNVLIPNALIRVYQGFGGRDKSIEDALDDGNLILMGVFLIDEVRVGTDGILLLRCRDMAKLLIEQQMFPPLMPNGWYPLHYYRWVLTDHYTPPVEVYDEVDPDPGVPAGTGQGPEGRKFIPDGALSADGQGYWLVGTDGGVFSFNVPFYGSRGNEADPAAFSSMAADPLGRGYWLCTREGHVYTFGEVLYYGGVDGASLSPIVRIAAHPNGRGYWLMAESGHVWAFGDAQFYGQSNGATAHPMVGFAPTRTGNGYWLMSAGGAIFTHGDALYHGGFEDHILPLDPASDLAADPFAGYWCTTNLGRVQYKFADTINGYAPNGEFDSALLNDPINAIVITPSGNGYLLFAGDGGVFSFGDAPFWGSLPDGFTWQTKSDGDYLDYSDIVKDILRWAGWLAYGDGDDFVYGNIESTGAYAEEEISPDTFDKKPVIDALNTLKEIVGYHLWVDEEGAVHFESPNWYEFGNLDEDGDRQESLVEIDEKYQLTDYTVSYTDGSVRSEIIISSHDPTASFTGTVTTRQTYDNDLLRGMVRPAMWVNDVLTNESEQRAMLERIEDHIRFSYRMGTVECIANPQVQINDQVRIYERQTGDTFVHYVRGIRTDMDLDSGTWMMTLTTNWLGEDWTD